MHKLRIEDNGPNNFHIFIDDIELINTLDYSLQRNGNGNAVLTVKLLVNATYEFERILKR
ncbi:MAG: hypothetical protein Q4D26_10585 [Clostridia bacterium]|nr:hypothetical protein [Clostridia bacterium]